MTKYNELIINKIKEIEGYALRKAYGPFKNNLALCDAIVKVAQRAITEIENTSRDIPRCRKFFYLETNEAIVDSPHLDEFWRQVRQEIERQRSLK